MTTVTWPEVGLVARRRTSRPPASQGCCCQRHPLPSRPRESQRTVCPPRAQCLDAHRVHAACASSRSTTDRPPPGGPATPSHADDTLPRARRASAGPSAVGPGTVPQAPPEQAVAWPSPPARARAPRQRLPDATARPCPTTPACAGRSTPYRPTPPAPLCVAHRVLPDPGPLPAALGGRAFGVPLAPEPLHHLESQAPQPLEPGAFGTRPASA